MRFLTKRAPQTTITVILEECLELLYFKMLKNMGVNEQLFYLFKQDTV